MEFVIIYVILVLVFREVGMTLEEKAKYIEESKDLTNDFFTEVKGKSYTLKRK